MQRRFTVQKRVLIKLVTFRSWWSLLRWRLNAGYLWDLIQDTCQDLSKTVVQIIDVDWQLGWCEMAEWWWRTKVGHGGLTSTLIGTLFLFGKYKDMGLTRSDLAVKLGVWKDLVPLIPRAALRRKKSQLASVSPIIITSWNNSTIGSQLFWISLYSATAVTLCCLDSAYSSFSSSFRSFFLTTLNL